MDKKRNQPVTEKKRQVLEAKYRKCFKEKEALN